VQDGVILQALAQFKGGQHRPPGMILLCPGGAEDSREAVTR
jgi:hypothetical protein